VIVAQHGTLRRTNVICVIQKICQSWNDPAWQEKCADASIWPRYDKWLSAHKGMFSQIWWYSFLIHSCVRSTTYFISYSFMCSFNNLSANYKISTNIHTHIHITRKIKWNKITQQNSVKQKIRVKGKNCWFLTKRKDINGCIINTVVECKIFFYHYKRYMY
jgi:hypothetical protein